MGLDMYLTARVADNTEPETIGQWRKHANLHGYMAKLYEDGGGQEEFNCVPLELTKEICEDVIERSRNHALTKAQGFFWGESMRQDDEETIGYMEIAIERIKSGHKVYYDSWW